MSQNLVTYRLLSDSDFDALHSAFLVAFSDYQMNMNVSPERFRERLVRDGVQMQLSAAAFVNHEIIGFYINGLGKWKELLTTYDAGTAIVPTYRGRGISRQLFDFLLPHLQSVGVEQYLLEVITTNAPAVSLYRKLGFAETRTFAVFRANERYLPGPRERTIRLRDVQDPDWHLFQSFWGGEPSWQNSIEAIKRIRSKTQMVAAFFGDECVGYGVMQLSTGNLMQLAVSPSHRRKLVGSTIVGELQSRLNPGELLKAVNVDRRLHGTLAFYETPGFTHILDQFEMIRSV